MEQLIQFPNVNSFSKQTQARMKQMYNFVKESKGIWGLMIMGNWIKNIKNIEVIHKSIETDNKNRYNKWVYMTYMLWETICIACPKKAVNVFDEWLGIQFSIWTHLTMYYRTMNSVIAFDNLVKLQYSIIEFFTTQKNYAVSYLLDFIRIFSQIEKTLCSKLRKKGAKCIISLIKCECRLWKQYQKQNSDNFKKIQLELWNSLIQMKNDTMYIEFRKVFKQKLNE